MKAGREPLIEKAVELAEDQGSAEGSEGVGEPIAGIVAGAVCEERLMELVHESDEGEDDGDGGNEFLPWKPFAEVECCREEPAASEEIAEMGHLVGMGDVEGEGSRRVKLITVGKKGQKDEPKDKTGSPKAGALLERTHRLIVVSAATHFFLHPLGKPLLHHGLIVEEAGAGDPLDA